MNGLRLASVYVPNGRAIGTDTFAAKLAFLDAMGPHVSGLDVVGGDMNVCPTDDDVYDPAAFVGETHVTPDERERLAAVIDAGMVDAYRSFAPMCSSSRGGTTARATSTAGSAFASTSCS